MILLRRLLKPLLTFILKWDYYMRFCRAAIAGFHVNKTNTNRVKLTAEIPQGFFCALGDLRLAQSFRRGIKTLFFSVF